MIRNALRWLERVLFEDLPDIFEARGVWSGEAAADGGGLVADDVGEQECDDGGRGGLAGEVASLQGRDVLADGVDLAYLRAAPQECAVEGFEVFEGDTGCRIRQERRGPSGDENQQEVFVLELF